MCDCRPSPDRWQRQRLRSAVPGDGGPRGACRKSLFSPDYHPMAPPRTKSNCPLNGSRLAERRRSDDPPKGRFPPDSPPILAGRQWGGGGGGSIIRQNGDVRGQDPADTKLWSRRIFRHNGDVRTRIFRHNGDIRGGTADGMTSQVIDSRSRIPPPPFGPSLMCQFPKTVDRRATARTQFKKRAKTALTPSTRVHASSWPTPRDRAS